MLLFVDLNKKDGFKLESWEFVSANGGLQKLIQDMGRDYDAIYNIHAVIDTFFRKAFVRRDIDPWLTPELFQEISSVYLKHFDKDILAQ